MVAALITGCSATAPSDSVARSVVSSTGATSPPPRDGWNPTWAPSWTPSPPRHHEPTQPPPPDPNPSGIPAVDMPRRALTPGTTFRVGIARICTPGYASSVRDVADALKSRVYARYHVAWVPYRHEVDHLISLELGGSNALRNLWPEPYAGRWGARTKDVLENRLHDLVCSRQLSLRSAQHQEATNWAAAYRRYVGGRPGGAGDGSGESGPSPGGYYASSYPGASTIYCAGDPAWKALSKTYLVHFSTWARAHTRFPSYRLHQPC
jgi:hypothetical protein